MKRKLVINETYYSIQIGDGRRHHPYLMLSADNMTPALFATREAASAYLLANSQPCRKVVRVRIRTK